MKEDGEGGREETEEEERERGRTGYMACWIPVILKCAFLLDPEFILSKVENTAQDTSPSS